MTGQLSVFSAAQWKIFPLQINQTRCLDHNDFTQEHNMAQVSLPSALRNLTAQQAQVEAAGNNVGEVLQSLAQRYPDLRHHLFTDRGRLRNFVNVFVGDEDIRYLQNEATPLHGSEVISIVPAVAGGR
jgi:molybdopterin converting factor small subunit